MNWRAIWAIVRKDIRVVLQNKGVTIPLVVVPLILFVGIPVLSAFAPALVNIPGGDLQEIEQLLATMPPALQAQLAGYDPLQQSIVFFLTYLMAPMYLIVPLMVSSVIAADSFAGEKERKTLEALLYTPTTDRELLVGKLLSAWLPALAVSWASFVLYAVAANLAAGPIMGGFFFPNATWMVLALWVAPAFAGLGLLTMVLVSARAQGFQDAYQTGTIVVLGVIVLVIGQATGVIYFSLWLVLALGLLIWLLDLALLWYGSRSFQRSELIARL